MIDVTFDFTSDSKGYWDGFLERDILAGMSSVDPDKASATLKECMRTQRSMKHRKYICFIP